MGAFINSTTTGILFEENPMVIAVVTGLLEFFGRLIAALILGYFIWLAFNGKKGRSGNM